MDGSGQDNDAARAGEQPRYPLVDTQVHATLGHVFFDSVQARAARVDDIFRYAPYDGHYYDYEEMIRIGRLASRRGFGGHAYGGGEATRTWAVASRDTDGSGQNNGAAAGEQPHPLPAGTPVLEPSSFEREFFDGFGQHDYGYHLLGFFVGGNRHGDMNEYGGDAYRGGGFGAVPASDDEIARLEKATVRDTREAECVVCMESFEEGDEIRKMPCSHGFHEACIFKWLRVSGFCPHCRFAMPADDKWL